MTFTAAIRNAFANYAVFTGRATRSEYWWFYLFTIILNIVFELASDVSDDPGPVGLFIIAAFSIALLIPSIAVAARRLHDVNRSGWWQLIALTIVGIFLLLYWLAKKGTDGPNRFGEDRLAAVSALERPNIVT